MDIRNPHFLAFAAAERQFLQSEYDDYAIANSGSLACFRYVAIIVCISCAIRVCFSHSVCKHFITEGGRLLLMQLMLLLLIRQTLMVTRDFAMVQDPSSFFNVSGSDCSIYLFYAL